MEISVSSYDTNTSWNGPDDSNFETVINAFVSILQGQTWPISVINKGIREYVDNLDYLEEMKENSNN